MWQRFTEPSKRVVFYAQQEAGVQGVAFVTPEHILLGLLRERSTAAGQILTQLGVKISSVEAEVRTLPSDTPEVLEHEMQLAKPAKKVIDYAYDETQILRMNEINTAHLLLGVMREGGIASQIIQNNGVTFDAVRAAAARIGSEQKTPPAPPRP